MAKKQYNHWCDVGIVPWRWAACYMALSVDIGVVFVTFIFGWWS